ncbi:MAG TPA: HDOD domain-containing protein [Opitutaceae bacterium]
MIPTLAQVCEKALRLPCAPSLLPRLIDVLARPDSDIDDLEALIRIDPVLVGAVLRLANSAFFGGGSAPVETLSEAVLRLGQREIYRLTALSVAGRWTTYEVNGYRWEPGDFCRASLVTAVAAELLAERSGRVDPQAAYSAGMVHALGKLAVAYGCAEQFGAIRAHQQEFGCTWLEAETAVLGYNHALVSAELLKSWRFPDAFVAVAAHNPPTAVMPAEHLPLAVHVHAANYLAATFGAGQGEEGLLIALNSELLTAWGFTPEVLEAALPDVFDRATRLLHEKLATGKVVF